MQDSAASLGRKPSYFYEYLVEKLSLFVGGVIAYEDGPPPTRPQRPANVNLAEERDKRDHP